MFLSTICSGTDMNVILKGSPMELIFGKTNKILDNEKIQQDQNFSVS